MQLLRCILVGALAVTSAVASSKTQQLAKREDTKYFHEPGGDNTLGHYDARYFKNLVPYEEHSKVLQHLIRSYLEAMRRIHAETWLAHGTLLGWWWNGRIMPWDYDLDVQVSSATLHYLGRNFNQTHHAYDYTDDATGEPRKKEYLLDINPHHSELDRGDGQNVIDARWIDVSNGMFIDITGLAERKPAKEPGVWSCKNFHKYQTTELYPMRQSEFEGVPATIPYAFDRILTAEYGAKSLVTTQFAGHRWEPALKEWVKLPEEEQKRIEEEEKKRKEEEEKKKEEEQKKKEGQ